MKNMNVPRDATPSEQTAFDAQMVTEAEMRIMATGSTEDKDPYIRMLSHLLLRTLDALDNSIQIDVEEEPKSLYDRLFKEL